MLPFESQMNSLDPQLSDEDKAKKFKNLIKERYIITKNTNTSYMDAGEMIPIERKYIIEFLEAESKQMQEELNKKKQQLENKRK